MEERGEQGSDIGLSGMAGDSGKPLETDNDYEVWRVKRGHGQTGSLQTRSSCRAESLADMGALDCSRWDYRGRSDQQLRS